MMNLSPLFKPGKAFGSILAMVIFSVWGISLIWILSLPSSILFSAWILPLVLGRTFLHTGLFVIAHDAIHGSLVPDHYRANHSLGKLALRLYAFLPYEPFRARHWRHHRYPGQIQDPDFHDGTRADPLRWYLKFMGEYLQPTITIPLLIFYILTYAMASLLFQVALMNFILGWLLPLWLSSIQLFVFGTYLPHKNAQDAQHRAISSNYPQLLSLLTCYHFGYHWEHHEHPALPWYRLPAAHSQISDC